MRTIKMIGLAIVAVVALSAVSVASASAEEFIASKTGKIKGKQTTNQEFKTGGGSTVVCKKAEPSGEVTKLKGTEQESTVAYSECTVSGLGSASVTPATYTFFIPLLVSVLTNNITIKATALGVKCTIVVKPQMLVATGNMTELNYENKSGKLLFVSKVTKIASEITESNNESLCGKVGELKEGTYTGSVEAEVEGGTIEVK
jgi:hypothetical protein